MLYTELTITWYINNNIVAHNAKFLQPQYDRCKSVSAAYVVEIIRFLCNRISSKFTIDRKHANQFMIRSDIRLCVKRQLDNKLFHQYILTIHEYKIINTDRLL